MIHWLLLILLLWAVPGVAATFYVSQGASGSGCSTTDSSGTNRSTINAGISCLNAGDTLVIHGGTYNEDVAMNRTGSNWTAGLITIKAAPQETVIVPRVEWFCNPCYVELQRLIVDCGTGASTTCIQGGGSSFYRMRDVESRGGGQGYLMGGGAHDLEIIGFHSHHHGINTAGTIICPPGQEGQCHGLYGGGNNILIEGGDLHHNNGYGMQFRVGPDSNITIRSNKMHHNTSGGIIAFVGVYDVYNNVSYSNGSGFWVVGAGGTSNVYQNTAYGNTSASGGIFVRGDEGNVRIFNNISLTNSGGNIVVESGATNVTLGTNLTTGSIGFQDPNAADFRLTADDNGGQFLSGSQYQVDFLGVARSNPPDRGAYEFGGAPPPPNPDPTGLQVELRADGNNYLDSSGKAHHGTPHNGVLANITPAIVGSSSFGLDGVDDYISVAAPIALKPLNFGISYWRRGTTAPAGEYCQAMRMGHAWGFGYEQDGRPFCWVNEGPTVTSPTLAILGTGNKLVSCGYNGTTLSLWIDTALVAQSTPSVPLVYLGGEELWLGGGTGDALPCPGTFDNFRLTDIAYTQADINNLFAEQTSVDGTSLTHTQFERANMAIGSILAIDANLPAHDRTQAVALAVAIQRVGTTISQYFALECSKNGGAFSTLTNLFGTLGARIAPDSALNMGDSVPVTLPTGGFTGVAGRVVANTINTGFTTTLATGQQTQWRYTLDFGGPAVSGDTFDCRPGGLDSYANVMRITLADPSVFLGIKGSTLKGFQFR